MANFTSNSIGTFQLSYAGIPLVLDFSRCIRMAQPHAEQEDSRNLAPRKHQPQEDFLDQLDKMLPFCYWQDWNLPSDYPGRNLGSIARQDQIGPQPNPSVKIQDYYYPPTASRWSVFRGLATSSQVQAILAVTGGNTPAPFIMQSTPLGPLGIGTNFLVETNLYCLPPRPLAEHGGPYDGLFLLTLVDERFYFDGSPVLLHPNKNTTWQGLIDELASVLDIAIDAGVIDPVYGQPEADSHLWSNFESATVLLDAIAYNIGKVVVRNLNGSYTLLNIQESTAVVLANRGNASIVVRLAGGNIFEIPKHPELANTSVDRNAIVPTAVVVSFPLYVYTNTPVPHFLNSRYQNQRPSAWMEESYGDVYTVTVPISDGGPFVEGLTGISTETLHDTAKALLASEAATVPDNADDLEELAIQLAQDFYGARAAAALDEIYPGTFVWQPEGIHDLVWSYSARSQRACCRVLRTQWNQRICNFQHATPPLEGFSNTPAGVGGPSVAQSWVDSQTNVPPVVLNGPVQSPPLATTLADDLAVGATQAIFARVDYLPTQNRWRGQVDDEIILFEGTSGGIAGGSSLGVDIVYRGIDGTLEDDHDSGTEVDQLTPSTAYGINLVRHEKAQFIYPSEWTSGGIQGVNVVPQIQSVFVKDDVGKLINKIQHYSGSVEIYNTSQMSGFQWLSAEPVWVVERSAQSVTSGFRYDGQLVGYSASGQVAPVYVVDQGGTGGGDGDCGPWNGLVIRTTGDIFGVDTLRFSNNDFQVIDNGPGPQVCEEVLIRTVGLTRSIQVLFADCSVHTLVFVDGLLQQVTP